MVPKISVDTANLEGAEGNVQDIGMRDLSEAWQSNLSPTSAHFEKRSYLSVPPSAGHALSPSSDISSTGWDNTTAHDNEKDRILELNQVKDIVSHDEEDSGPFAFTNKQLQALVDPKHLEMLRQLGGLQGLAKGLQSDLRAGLSWDETTIPVHVSLAEVRSTQKLESDPSQPSAQVAKKPSMGVGKSPTARSTMKTSDGKMLDRQRIYGTNVLPERKTKNIFQLMWVALQDKILIILSVAAVVSLSLGLYETFDGEDTIDPLTGKAAPHLDWVEGVAIIVAIAIVTIVGSVNDYQKEQQFAKLNKKKEDRMVTITRSGKISRMSVFDVVVGDVMNFEPGDVLPVDGVLISGHNVKCDESAATGESDTLPKTPGDECIRSTEPGDMLTKRTDPFMLSGAKVVEGVGSFLVTAVGPRSFNGKTMMAMLVETEDTPLQAKLNVIATTIAKCGGAAAILLFVVAFIEFLIRLRHNNESPSAKGQDFLDIFIIAVTVVVVAIPEGLPLAVTLALAFATTRMLKDNNLVRILKSCETMGVATTICSDKTGTLTQNRMTVVAGTMGTSHKFVHNSDDQPEPTGALLEGKIKRAEKSAREGEESSVEAHLSGGSLSVSQFISKLSQATKQMFVQSIALNSTAFEGVDEHGEQGFVGSKTETALLEFAKLHLGMEPVSVIRANHPPVHMIPFSSSKKCMGVVIRQHEGFRLHVKGASEIVLGFCANTIQDPFMEDQITQPISPSDRAQLLETIDTYANQSLRTIGIVYKDFPQWPPANAKMTADGNIALDDLFDNMTLLGLVGIMDPLRPGVKQAVLDCQGAGVKVRMVTGDNLITARAIATECGIYTGGVVMEGPVFRKLNTIEMDQIIPQLEVLARSSPEDKQILVKRLKHLGEVVAVTGDGTNDGPALKMADVGFSMGIAGTEVAKEASAIILMDDNFASIVKAMAWGRAVNDAVKKFLQFQITVNITAVVITFVSTVSGSNEKSVLTAVQLLWVNLIMDTLAALALATDPPSATALKKPPSRKSDGLISFTMWKMIIGQAIYQIVVVFVLYYAGQRIFAWPAGPNPEPNVLGEEIRDTVVFNTFVWMQIFNQLNNRRLDNQLNVFEGIFHNYFYWLINAVMIGCQVLIIFVGGRAFSITRIGGTEWAICIVLGFLSIPIAVVIRLIPNNLIRIFVPKAILTWNEKRNVEISEESRAEWNPVINQVRDELAFIRNIRSSRRIGSLGKHKKSTEKYFQGDKDRYKRANKGSVAAAILSPSFVAASAAGFGPPSPRSMNGNVDNQFPDRSGSPTPAKSPRLANA